MVKGQGGFGFQNRQWRFFVCFLLFFGAFLLLIGSIILRLWQLESVDTDHHSKQD